MFNILIVEDDTDTSVELRELIREEIPEAEVMIAPTVDQGRNLIMQARRFQNPFQAIILDMKLPKTDPGGPPEFDNSLCRDIKKFMPDALVAHITAFYKNEEVSSHLETFHGKHFGNRAIWLGKLEKKSFSRQLLDELKPFLYGLRIQEEIRRVFNLDEKIGTVTQNRKRFVNPRRGGKSMTHEVGGLTREISERWKSLDEDVREQVRDIFTVREDGGEVIVSLFKASHPEAEDE
jgi:CheY-like chemotaxis protein